MSKHILTRQCDCGEDVFLDEGEPSAECWCGRTWKAGDFKRVEIADIISEKYVLKEPA